MVRRRCRTRLATLHEKPDACPEALGTEGGRDLDDETDRRPGGPLRATFEASYTRDGVDHTLSGHLRTFFRDVAPLPESSAPER